MSHILRATPDISLFKDDEIPPHLREVAILTGYRSPSSSVKDCALSVFVASNETLNFWTHFIPTFYFIYQLLTFWDILKVITDPYYWPFVIYMFTICLYPLISALAHTFCSTSDMARHVWFFLDYGGLSLYGYGAGILIKAYAFPEELQDSIFGMFFMEVLVFLCITCSTSACFSRFLTSLFWIKIFRLGAFALPWVWDSIPVIYRLSHSKDLLPEASEHYSLQFFFSFCIGFFYASHLPERLAPGKFDFLGNSHQLLHISGILATHHQMSAAIIDMSTRREFMQSKYPLPEYWSVHVFLLVLFSISVTIVIFILWARHYEKAQEAKRQT
ncbi:membrane progestin receptor gamma-like isoform X2 [Uloborus diversus]|nr:membrane progestin receptor gamma-like isoform X2 [Uloborus diversus]XP_054712185.1 membrane progestin receptor gamma-like isoform X2 [Uloborus diversus]